MKTNELILSLLLAIMIAAMTAMLIIKNKAGDRFLYDGRGNPIACKK